MTNETVVDDIPCQCGQCGRCFDAELIASGDAGVVTLANGAEYRCPACWTDRQPATAA